MRKDLPVIIQGGMGAAVSDWQLANAVSSQGQLGVVSGVALGAILARRLEMGDPGEHMRRALAAFPFKDAAQRILDRYFIEGGKDADARFAVKPMAKMNTSRRVEELIVAGNFAEIFLAKEGHDNPVGVNFLEKIQVTTLPSLYGAMLAGVDYVLMGAGIPRYIPGILDRLADGFDVVQWRSQRIHCRASRCRRSQRSPTQEGRVQRCWRADLRGTRRPRPQGHCRPWQALLACRRVRRAGEGV